MAGSVGRWMAAVPGATIPAEESAVKLVNDVVSELHLGKHWLRTAIRCIVQWTSPEQLERRCKRAALASARPVCVLLCACVSVCACAEEATLDALRLHSQAKVIASPSRPVNTAHWRTCTYIIKADAHTCRSYTSCVIAMMVL